MGAPRHRFIHIGTGGWGSAWCFGFLPRLVQSGRLEPAAAVDIVSKNLRNAVKGYGIGRDRCFTEAAKAFEKAQADFVILATPPDQREQYVQMAAERGMDILCEKPVADTMEACVRIHEMVKRAGVKMGVTMSHRFGQDQQSLQRLVHSGELGPISSVVGRFTDCRGRSGGYGEALTRIPDVMLIHASVHHFDIFRALARSNAARVYARSWTPPGVEYEGDTSAFAIFEMENGVVCQYEGALTNAATLNDWEHEYFRAECDRGTAIVDNRQLTVWRGGENRKWEVERVALMERPTWMNEWLIEQFLDWREGGAPMETSIDDNMQCLALTFAAVESAHTGKAVEVQEYLRHHMGGGHAPRSGARRSRPRKAPDGGGRRT